MHEARYYIKLNNGKLSCILCPWNCKLKPGQTGNCKVRVNENGKLLTTVYNRVAALGVDPIEKKPLYHFHPGKNILSIGEVGCNLHCNFCQNHRISQCYASNFSGFQKITPKKIITEAQKTWNNIGIAYTYNEPFTFYEYMFDTAKLAHKNGLKNVVVSNGYVNPEPLLEILSYVDAFNIDLKAFSDSFYKNQTKGKLEPVLETLKIIAESNTHVEITNLIIPELNDKEKEFEEMVKWIKIELGESVPLHLSRYFPQFKSSFPQTPLNTLERFYEIAKQHLHHVFLGNVSDEKRSSTFCSNCNSILIERSRYNIQFNNIHNNNNRCSNCNSALNFVVN